jgi:hypothetical protein
LYLLLVLAAAVALWARREPGRLPSWLESAAPWLFLVFTAAFATYRFRLVRARKYPASKAFFQVGAAMLFFMLLMPGRENLYQQPAGDEVQTYLQDSDPRLRAMAAELAGYRGDAVRYGPSLARALNDPDAHVRETVHHALVKLHGSDLGSPGAPEAVKAWNEAFP